MLASPSVVSVRGGDEPRAAPSADQSLVAQRLQRRAAGDVGGGGAGGGGRGGDPLLELLQGAAVLDRDREVYEQLVAGVQRDQDAERHQAAGAQVEAVAQPE